MGERSLSSADLVALQAIKSNAKTNSFLHEVVILVLHAELAAIQVSCRIIQQASLRRAGLDKPDVCILLNP